MKNDYRLSPDDPRLTAYALGQLHGDDRAAVEAALRNDPEARAVVEQTRAFAAQLESALANEKDEVEVKSGETPPLPFDRAAILPGLDPRVLDGGRRPHREKSKLLTFPNLYYVIGSAAAACFAVVIALREEPPPREIRYYREFTLGPAPQHATAAHEGNVGADDELASAVANAERPLPQPITAPPPMTFELKKDLLAKASAGSVPPPTSVASVGAQDTDIVELAPFAVAPKYPAKPQAPAGAVSFAAEMPESARAAVALRRERAAVKREYRFPPDEKFVIEAVPDKGAANGHIVPQLRDPFSMEERTAGNTGFGLAPGAALAFPRTSASWSGARFAPFSAYDLYPGPVRLQRGDLYARMSTISRGRNAGPAERRGGYVSPVASPFSTVPITTGTASYADVRRAIDSGRLPSADAVHVADLLNYFPNLDRAPGPQSPVPLAASLEVAEAPWAPTHRLIRVALKARDLAPTERATANLVFLIDVSSSMDAPDKLPLIKESLRHLVGSMRSGDRIAMVTYGEKPTLVLPSTGAGETQRIISAIDGLASAGSLHSEDGFKLAFEAAKAGFANGGTNRVILCTDGSFSAEVMGELALSRALENSANAGVGLSIVGFGIDEWAGGSLEQMARSANGEFGVVRTRRDGERLLAMQLTSGARDIATDLNVKVDFNPAEVAGYRLVGYEAERGASPAARVASGPAPGTGSPDGVAMQAGQAVAALYEIIPVGAADAATAVPPAERSRYAAPDTPSGARNPGELLTVTIRYKQPASQEVSELELPLSDRGVRFANASSEFRFAAAVAGYGMILRNSAHKGTVSIEDVITWAATAAETNEDPGGYRAEFVDLARRTQKLM